MDECVTVYLWVDIWKKGFCLQHHSIKLSKRCFFV